MRKILISILAASLLSFPAFAAMPGYTLVKGKSALKFYAIQNGAPVEGEFKNFNAEIHFSQDRPEESTLKVEVEMGSVSASYDEVVKNLKMPDWLSVETFPKAVFTSKSMTRMPNSDNYYAEGKLTLRGKTLPVTVNFLFEHLDDKVAVVKGFATLRRTDFGVGQGKWAKDDVVKNEVRIEFRVVAEKQ